MPLETKTHVLSFLDTLHIKRKGVLYNQIMSHLENNKEEEMKEKLSLDAFFEDVPVKTAKPRIHISDETCTSCQG